MNQFSNSQVIPDEKSSGHELLAFCAAELDPFFWRPERIGAFSAWWSHVPFAHWLVKVTRPRLLVELGTHTGVSYSAFCEAIVREQLSSRCFAIDTWKGDEQTGPYDDSVYSDLLAFHEKRYVTFSHLLRCSFDEALPQFGNESIDLLHIDGLHTYEAVRHDFECWRPKLSSRSIVLFHDTNERGGNFGVWRLWAELLEQFPGFEFVHGHGLGVLATGQEVPEPITKLCSLQNTRDGGLIRNRLAFLGERWSSEMREQYFREEVVAREKRIRAIAQEKEETESRLKAQVADALAEQEAKLNSLLDEQKANEIARRVQAEKERAHAVAESERLKRELDATRRQLSEGQQRFERQIASATLLAQARAQAEKAAFKIKETEAKYHRANLDLNWIQSELVKARAEKDRVVSSPVWKATRPLRKLVESVKRSKNSESPNLARNIELIAKSTLFDSSWYCETYPDVAAAGIEPITHYLKDGAREGRNPGPEFDGNWYLEHYPDVAAAGDNPLIHYLLHGQAEGREIQPVASATVFEHHIELASQSGLFDVDWYLAQNPDVLTAKENPIAHYLRCGAREGRNPGPEFDGNWYLEHYPDVAAAGDNPLIHYLLHGQAEGREIQPVRSINGHDRVLESQEELTLDNAARTRFQGIAPLQTFPIPKRLPRLTLLIDKLDSRSLSNSGMTALIISAFVADRTGIDLRVVTRGEEPNISGIGTILAANGIAWSGNIECLYSAPVTGREIPVSENDLFLTTSWSTTRSARGVIAPCRLIYLVQEDERILYPFGDERLRCEETLGDPDIRFLVNSEILFEHLTSGPDALLSIKDRGISFELAFPTSNSPGFERSSQSPTSARKNFLFATSPDDPTNLYYRGLEVITSAIEHGLLRNEDWNFYFAGKSLRNVVLPGNIQASFLERPSGDTYSVPTGQIDLGLCLMDMPHPSYSLLDLVAKGSVVLTNRRGTGTSLARYSKNIICTDPSVEALLNGLDRARKLAANTSIRLENHKRSNIQREWAVALEPVLQAFTRADAVPRA